MSAREEMQPSCPGGVISPYLFSGLLKRGYNLLITHRTQEESRSTSLERTASPPSNYHCCCLLLKPIDHLYKANLGSRPICTDKVVLPPSGLYHPPSISDFRRTSQVWGIRQSRPNNIPSSNTMKVNFCCCCSRLPNIKELY
jgi:hypothetical protein